MLAGEPTPESIILPSDTRRWKFVLIVCTAVGIFLCAMTAVYRVWTVFYFMPVYLLFIIYPAFHTNKTLFKLRIDRTGMEEVEWGKERRFDWGDVADLKIVGDHYDLVVGVVLVPAKRTLRMPWRNVDYVMKNNYGLAAESLVELMNRYRSGWTSGPEGAPALTPAETTWKSPRSAGRDLPSEVEPMTGVTDDSNHEDYQN